MGVNLKALADEQLIERIIGAQTELERRRNLRMESDITQLQYALETARDRHATILVEYEAATIPVQRRYILKRLEPAKNMVDDIKDRIENLRYINNAPTQGAWAG